MLITALLLAAILAADAPKVLPTAPTSTPAAPAPKKVNIEVVRIEGQINPEISIYIALAMQRIAHIQPYVIIEINSGGGNVASGMGLATTMERLGVPVFCLVDGRAASMAFYLLQSCSYRFMTINSTLMVHNPSIEPAEGGDEYYFERTMLFLRLAGFEMAMHYSRRMDMPPEIIRERIKGHDWEMDPVDAFAFSAVDEIVANLEDGRLLSHLIYLRGFPKLWKAPVDELPKAVPVKP